MKNLELIEKYLNEELSAAEQNQFEQLQKNDADFAEEVQMAVAVNASFNVQQKLRWQKLANEQGISTETPIRQLNPAKRSISWIRSVAAVAILGVGLALGWMMFSGSDLGTLADDHLMDIHQAPTVVRETEDIESNWENAIDAYKSGNFNIAVAAIEKSFKGDEGNQAEKHFYLGLSHLYNEVADFEKAIFHLEKSQSLNAGLYGAMSNWYMSLAHLKKG
ncbi:MAG: hypothetical protein AAF573_22725, partial [Bacteroidota bacterium]